ncbi:MAG: terminase TerL endonuclease subunit [Prolixibacteraceae bacterium]
MKSNPSMGVIIDLETLIEDFEKSKKVQADMNSFIIKNLNYYKEHLQTWIEDDYYKLCFKDFNMKDLKGCKAYMGLDLASTRDLAALVIIIEKEGKLFVKSEHFLPQNKNSIVRMNGLDLTD